MIMISTDLTSKVTEKGKTKACKAEDNMVVEAETPAYSIFGASLDKVPDVPHVPIDREASTLFNRRATDEWKFRPSIASEAPCCLADNMPEPTCKESSTCKGEPTESSYPVLPEKTPTEECTHKDC